MKKVILIICILIFSGANAQKWGMYTLYSVKGSNSAQLVDTNNTIYKTWTFPSSKKTCFSSYLIPGDTLVRTVSYTGAILSGGPFSGEIQKIDWNNNIVWDYIYSDSTHVLHHDICPMPNGNVLMIALEVKKAPQGTQAGGSANMQRRSDMIIEVMPTGPVTGTIVWQWHLWDHLCQNYNPAKANYVASLVDNPQLIDINYDNSIDFFHMNGIDYNAILDQITFSSYTFSEIYVIDHSTNTAQATGHTGGNSGKGGDIIYRWGNPSAYGAIGNTVFNVVHDAHWVSPDNIYFPNYLCGYNNLGGVGAKTAINVLNPPYNGYNYTSTLGTAYEPLSSSWLYTTNSVNSKEGSSQQLPNGNSLVCFTFLDTITEVNYSGETLWTYVTPGSVSNALRYSKCYVRGHKATATASAMQIESGALVSLSSSASSATETNPTYTFSWTSVPAGFTSGLQNPEISPIVTTTYIVTITNPDLGCFDSAFVTINVNPSGINSFDKNNVFSINPNPAKEILTININKIKDSHNTIVNIYDLQGELMLQQAIKQETTELTISNFAKGMYILKICNDKNTMVSKFIKE